MSGIPITSFGIEWAATLFNARETLKACVSKHLKDHDVLKNGWWADPAFGKEVLLILTVYVSTLHMEWKDDLAKQATIMNDEMPPRSLTDDPHLLDNPKLHQTLAAMIDKMTNLTIYAVKRKDADEQTIPISLSRIVSSFRTRIHKKGPR
jgi:hypothetical protein